MKRVLLSALLGFTLTGCPEPARNNDVPVAPESAAAPLGQIPPSAKPADTAVAAPPPAQTLAEPKPTAPTTATPSASAAAPSASASAGLVATKPASCLKDTDCSAGQVCDACAEGKCCASGCHTDAQCAVGQHCRQVACVRAPCPSKCEGGNAPPPGGLPGRPDPKGAPVK